MKTAILTLTLCIVLAFSAVASANLQLSAELSPLGGLNFSSLLGYDLSGKQWAAKVMGHFDPAEDLRIFSSFQTAEAASLSFSNVPNAALGTNDYMKHQLAQAAAGYKFLSEQQLTVFGGFGYQILSIDAKHTEFGAHSKSLVGQGFQAYLQVDLQVLDRLRTQAVILGSPWMSWRYSSGDEQHSKIAGTSYNYQLSASYSINKDYTFRVSYTGLSLGLEDFDHKGVPLPRTSGKTFGISAGISIEF